MKKLSECDVETGLAELKKIQKNDWVAFSAKLDKAVQVSNNSGENLLEMTHEDFINAGFTEDQAAACIFILTEEIAGREIETVSMFDKWFAWN
jgi:hypothetical protein